MKLNPIEQVFFDLFRPFFERHGFCATEWRVYRRSVNDVVQSISIGPIRNRNGTWDLTAGGIGIRIEPIEQLRAQEGPSDSPTVGIPIHLLKADKAYRSWRISAPPDVSMCAEEIQEQIEQYAIPYFARFSNSDAVVFALEAEDWTKWFVVTPDSRDVIAVCATWVRYGVIAAKAKCDDLLRKYEGRPFKFFIELRNLRKRLEASTEGA